MKTPYAMPGCDNCHETGVTRGYGGGPCPCLVRCFYCDALVPWSPDWEERPREPQCARCAAACQVCGADPPTLCRCDKEGKIDSESPSGRDEEN